MPENVETDEKVRIIPNFLYQGGYSENHTKPSLSRYQIFQGVNRTTEVKNQDFIRISYRTS